MVYSPEEIKAAGLDDFRVFLRQVWDFLGLPPPTPVQNDIAYNLQHGPRRLIIQAFRGVGKSWITVAFVLWCLLLNPQMKILVVSANQQLADAFSIFTKQLIHGMPMLQHLAPNALTGQRDSSITFDVGPATPSKDPSVKSAGITGQITGNRADLIVGDDVEVPKNSYTHDMREKLAELVKEFDAVLKPGGRVVYLGTPQVEDTLYNKLVPRGYEILVWPIMVPTRIDAYRGKLAPYILRLIDKGAAVGSPVDPKRFSKEDIAERRASYGEAGFALQFMLDTNPQEADSHPLKLRDLMIHDVDAEMGHVKVVWSSENIINTLSAGGFDGDHYVRIAWKSDEMVRYQGTVMAIDPSGRGLDETAYAIISYLNGTLYLKDVGGFRDGFGETTLRALATKAILHRVNYWIAEENYGGGMFNQLLKPVMISVAREAKLDPKNPDPLARPPAFDDEWDGWSSSQKENRILDTLEPLIKQHRLVVAKRVVEDDLNTQREKSRYSFVQQMTRMARLKGCLQNEDRLEAVSMACSYWTERMARDKDRALEDHKEEILNRELRRFAENAYFPGRMSLGNDDGGYRWR